MKNQNKVEESAKKKSEHKIQDDKSTVGQAKKTTNVPKNEKGSSKGHADFESPTDDPA